MHRTLTWHEIGIEQNLGALRDGIAARRALLPQGNAREIRMMGHWLSSIDRIPGKIAAIRGRVRGRYRGRSRVSDRQRGDAPPRLLHAEHAESLL